VKLTRGARQTQGRIYSQQGPVQKKCGTLQLGRQTLFFLEKLATFYSHHRVSAVTSQKLATFFCLEATFFAHHSPFHPGVTRPFFRHAKNTTPFVGGPFCGAPVRQNMLNMPKSAAGQAFG